MDDNTHPDFLSEISFEGQSFVDLGLQVLQGTVLQLVYERRGEITPLGTCFGITNSGLCMTARHVLEEGLSLAGVDPEAAGQLNAEEHGTFAALLITSEVNPDDPQGLVGGLIPIWRGWLIGGIDIGLVMLRLPIDTRTGETIRFPVQPLRLGLPAVGEPFFGVGYRSMDWTSGSGLHDYRVDHQFSATRGRVEELHLKGRDSVVLPFPCFRTSARLEGGMSGGPLVDHSGRVFGVVCSSYSTEDEGSGYISYGSLIAPSMLITLDVNEPDGSSRRAFLWEFVEGGAVRADTVGVEVTRNGDWLLLNVGGDLHIRAQLDG